jgi:hypothetical protein
MNGNSSFITIIPKKETAQLKTKNLISCKKEPKNEKGKKKGFGFI